MLICDTKTQVKNIKPQTKVQAYIGEESLTYVRRGVTARDGITGDNATGRFLADAVMHLLNKGIADTLKGAITLDIGPIRARSSEGNLTRIS